jgi:hypothetical protein
MSDLIPVDNTLTEAHQELAASVMPLLVGYLDTILPVYAIATPDKRAELIEHNPTLAAVIEAFRRNGIEV